MNPPPSPAIVAQSAVRRLPRWGLLLFCAIYVLAGFVGRDPWKRADITAFGVMLDLAQTQASWATPAPAFDALLPYWWGAAWIGLLAPLGVDASLAVRMAFLLLLALTLLAVWYAIYYLARSPRAQPVSFAFGGEARPTDYARAVADGGLLAFVACLGLAQQAHETTPALMQLCCTAMLLCALAMLPYRRLRAAALGVAAALALALSGAPTLSLCFGLLGAAVYGTQTPQNEASGGGPRQRAWPLWMALLLLVVLVNTLFDLWRWRAGHFPQRWVQWRDAIKWVMWFAWPAWPLALWTLWRWRAQWQGRCPGPHLSLPLGMVIVVGAAALVAGRSNTTLLLALPACAALAAFALPTFSRSAAAFIDWFAVLFFSFCALVLWFMWIAVQTGVPHKPAANVAKLVVGYQPQFHMLPFAAALAATALWLVLVRWRTARLQPALWKGMILSACGVTLCWVLLTTLWMPLLNYARGYTGVVQRILAVMHANPQPVDCVHTRGLDAAQTTALRYHARLPLSAEAAQSCHWLLSDARSASLHAQALAAQGWRQLDAIARPTDRNETIHVFVR